MKYLLHEGAAEDLRSAGNYYRERAGSVLDQYGPADSIAYPPLW